MLAISDTALSILNGSSFEIHYRLSSWLGEECLAEDIPATNVVEDLDWAMRVPERLSFRVPIEDDEGTIWVPTSYRSPLGWFGQRIHAQVGIGVEQGAIEWINRGIFLLHSADTNGTDVNVEALGLLQLVDEAVLATEFQPATGATFASTLLQLLDPGIPIDVWNQAPGNEVIPTSAVTWSDNRLECVYTILEAWSAQARMSQEGVLIVTDVPEIPDEGTGTDFFFDDTDEGTVINWSTSGTREDGFNAAVVEGVYDDDRGSLSGLPIVHTAYDTDSSSPYALGGLFSPYLVPRKFQQPLLNEHVPVLLAAWAKLRDMHRRAFRTVQIDCVPHPALDLDDVVSVTSARLGLDGELGRITAMRLPYGADGGAMQVTVKLAGFF